MKLHHGAYLRHAPRYVHHVVLRRHAQARAVELPHVCLPAPSPSASMIHAAHPAACRVRVAKREGCCGKRLSPPFVNKEGPIPLFYRDNSPAVVNGGEAVWVPRRRILVRWYDRACQVLPVTRLAKRDKPQWPAESGKRGLAPFATSAIRSRTRGKASSNALIRHQIH